MPAPKDRAPKTKPPADTAAAAAPPTPQDAAQALVDQLTGFYDALVKAQARAANAGDNARADHLQAQLDRLQPQLVDALQRLVAAIDSGQDITDLRAQMDALLSKARAAQAKVVADTAKATEIAGVVDTVAKVIKLAKTLAGG
jgi:hypothetical protein